MLSDPLQDTKGKLLIIDTDGDKISASLETQLRKKYSMHLADRPEAGQRIMRQTPAHVVVSDLYIPEMAAHESPVFRHVVKPWNAPHLDLIIENAFELHELRVNHQKHIREARSEFLAGMNHEIRTPLNAILGFSALLDPLITDQKQKSYLSSIRSGGKHLHALLDDISDFTSIEAGKMDIQPDPVSPRLIFHEVRAFFAPELSHKPVEFIVSISDDMPESLLLDEKRFRQILLNLVRSAVKFTEKGHIKILGKKLRSDENSCDLMIIVKDTGTGIPLDAHEKLFDLFALRGEKSTRSQGRTGLELFIVRQLVEMMNGEISLSQQEEKENTFKIVLRGVPIGEAVQITKTGDYPDHAPDVLGKATVLLVDDLELNRMLLKSCLKSTDIRMIEAENGQEALELAEKHRPDVILMDIRMPVMDGYEATRQIRENENLRHIPVIALTASPMALKGKNAVQDSFDGFLTKPVRSSDLFRELSRVLRSAENREKTHQTASEKGKNHISTGLSEESLRIISQLENEFMTLRNAVQQNKTFDEIAHFADQIRAFGEACSLEILTRFGSELSAHVRTFDIDAIENMLNAYPKIVEKVRGLGH